MNKNKIIKFTNGAILAKLNCVTSVVSVKVIETVLDIDGDQVSINKNSWEGVLPKIPKSIHVKYKKKALSHYKNKDDFTTTISIEKYNDLKEGFLQYAIEDADWMDGEMTFDDIDREYEYKKFLQSWVIEHKYEDIIEPVSFEIFECVNIPSTYEEHITSNEHSANFKFDNHYVSLNINPQRVITDIATKYGFNTDSNNKKYELGDSSWYFLKINGRYPFGTSCQNLYRLNLRYLTLDVAIGHVDKFRKAIDNAFKTEAAKVKNKEVDFKYVHDKISSILSDVDKINPKQKTIDYWFSAKIKINELLNSLVNECLE
jgi:hypothetical protein